jgi:hypothetical protein
MISIFNKVPLSSQPSLENAMCKVKKSLIHLPLEILQLILSYLAPEQKVDRDGKDKIRKQAHQYVLELLCVHSSLKAVGINYLWAYRVATIAYYKEEDGPRTFCQTHNEFKLCPDIPPGEDIHSVVKGLYCRWGRPCSHCENPYKIMKYPHRYPMVSRVGDPYKEIQGSSLFPLVARFVNLTELVLQIPLSTTALGAILQSCHLNLKILDYQSENRVTNSSSLPPLPKLNHLIIRFERMTSSYYQETLYNPICTPVVRSFLDAVSANLREMVIFDPTLEPAVITSLTALNGLRSLHILDYTYKPYQSTLEECGEVFPQSSKLNALSVPLSMWYKFPQGYFESLQVVNLTDHSKCNNSVPKNPFFTMALRSVSVDCPLDLTSLETLGSAPFLEHLELNLQGNNLQMLQHFAHVGVHNPNTFLQLKKLRIHQYYFSYMQKFELLKVTQFEFSEMVPKSDLCHAVIPEIPWGHQLISLKINCSFQNVTWNSQASFSKLDELSLSLYTFEAPVHCQFPALRKLVLFSDRLCTGLGDFPSTFPKLRTVEFSGYMSIAYRIPVKYLSAHRMSTRALNSLMKYDEVDTVEFQALSLDRDEGLVLYWRNTPSSIQLWQHLPSIQFVGDDSSDVYIKFLSCELNNEVILPVVEWYMKHRLARRKPNAFMTSPFKRFRGDAYDHDYDKATLSLIIQVEALQDSLSFKDLVEAIRGMTINCEINIISPRTKRM